MAVQADAIKVSEQIARAIADSEEAADAKLAVVAVRYLAEVARCGKAAAKVAVERGDKHRSAGSS